MALIAYLAHLGAYVPAESAIIGLADRIAARSATVALPLGLLAGGGALAGGGWEGSVEGGGGGVGRPSTFMADLAQVRHGEGRLDWTGPNWMGVESRHDSYWVRLGKVD